MQHLKDSIIEAIVPNFTRIEAQMLTRVALTDKEFWSTRELIERGWTIKQLDELVAAGQLARIDAGGSAGFKYPGIQLKQIIENYDSRITLAGFSRGKSGQS